MASQDLDREQRYQSFVLHGLRLLLFDANLQLRPEAGERDS